MLAETQDDRYPLSPGELVGHYEIRELIGQGGMGYVYRALDVKLVRDVALKCPLPALARDPDQRLRFVREARAASKLDHPNIVAVHEVFEDDGLPWLVMAMIEGGSLREHLQRTGPLPVREILSFGIGLADALQKAHDRNILHRDVNPRNILLASDGRAQISDFGLARALAPSAGTSETEEVELTQAGRPVGTPSYMSPEQILGLPVDVRSDVFALGALLHEMCSGKPPFARPNLPAVVEAVVHETPPGVGTLRDDLPDGLEPVVTKALAKEPDNRYQTAGTLARDLKSIQKQLEFADYVSSPTPVSAWIPRRGRPWIGAAAALALMVALGWSIRPHPDPFALPHMEAVVTWPSLEDGARLSPDAEWISFISDRSGRRELWLTGTESSEPRVISDHAGNVITHVWSPDGQQIAFVVFRADRAFLQIIPAFGGPQLRSFELPREAGDHSMSGWRGTRIYMEDNRRGLLAFDTTDGEIRLVLSRESAEGERRMFHVRDDERRLAYVVQNEEEMVLWVSDLDGGRSSALTDATHIVVDPHWLGRKHVAYTSNVSGQMDLWLTRVSDRDSRQLTFSSNEETVTGAADDGSLLVYAEAEERADLWVVDPGTTSFRQLTADALRDRATTVSRDRRLLAFQRSPPSLLGTSDMYDGRLMLGRIDAPREALPVADRAACPRLSPDGRRIAYAVALGPDHELWLQDLDTGHRWRIAERFKLPWYYPFPADWVDEPLAWNHDGSELFFAAMGSDGARDIRAVSVHRPDEGRVLVAGTPGVETSDLFVSPNGRELAYMQVDLRASKASIHRLSLSTGDTEAVLNEPVAGGDRFVLRGWIDDTTLLVFRGRINPDWSERLEPLLVDPEGRTTTLDEVPFGFGGTATLDSRRGRVYLTAADHAQGPHNLIELSLDTGRSRVLTSNDLPGISYSGIEVLDDGRVLFSQQKNDSNLWSVRFLR